MPAIRIDLQLSDGSFTSGMLRAGQSLGQFQKELARTDPHFRKLSTTTTGFITNVKRADTASRGFVQTLRDVSLVGAGLTMVFRGLTGASNGFMGSIVKTNADMERLRFQMEGMATSSEPIKEAAQNVDYLRQKITEMPFSLNELSTTFVKLKATGTDPMAGSMNALADGIAAFGGTDEQLHRVTLGITQMSGKSVIQMEEMRQQLAESMPAAMQIMARSMGVSVARLTDAIATGRLQAKPALDAFYSELDRTFGGAALRMMGTFSGQVTKLKANLQTLATGPGLDNFVQSALKDILVDINDFLDSDRARIWANNFGNFLSEVTNRMTSVAAVLYDLRQEFVILGKMMAAGLGLSLLGRSLSAVANTFNMAKLQVTAFSSSMKAANMQAALFQVQLRGVGFTASQVALTGLAAARTAIMGIGSALLAVAPWAVALGGAVMIAGNHFGWFGNKVAEAYDELSKFGAESQSQAEMIIDQRIAQLRAEGEEAQRLIEESENSFAVRRMGSNVETHPQWLENKRILAEVNEELETILADRERLISQSAMRERTQAERDIQLIAAEREQGIKQAYSQGAMELQKWQDEELAVMEETGRTSLSIEEEYQDRLRNLQANAKSDTLDSRRELLAEAIALRSKEIAADGEASLAVEARIEALRVLITQAREELQNVTVFDMNLGPDLENVDSKIERGQKALTGLTREIVGMKAELNGADSDIAQMMEILSAGDFGNFEEGGQAFLDLKQALIEATEEKMRLDKALAGQSALKSLNEEVLELQDEIDGTSGAVESMYEQIRNGDFGSIENGGESVRELHEALLEATAAKELLDKALSGRKAIESDIDKARSDILSDRLALTKEISGVELTQGEEILEKLRRGEYEALGSQARIRDAFQSILGMSNIQGTAMNSLADVMQKNTFGDPTIRRIKETTQALREMNGVTSGLEGTMFSMSNGARTAFNATLPSSFGNGQGLGQLSDREIELLAKTIEAEARGQGQRGMNAVASVIANRVNDGRYGQGVEGVIMKRGQFSPWNSVTGYAGGEQGQNMDLVRPSAEAWAAARGLQYGAFADETGGATHYYNPSVSQPNWAEGQNFNRIGDHVFGNPDGAPGRQGRTTSGQPAPRYDSADLQAQIDEAVAMQLAKQAEYEAMIAELIAMEAENAELGDEAAIATLARELAAKIKGASASENDSNLSALIQAIEKGEVGRSLDAEDPIYAKLIEAARELDRVETSMTEKRDARRDADSSRLDFDRQRADIAREIAEETARASNPDYQGESAELVRLNRELEEYVENIRLAEGEDSDAFRQAIAFKQQMLTDSYRLQAVSRQADMAAERREMEESTMSQRQVRIAEMNRKIAEVDRFVETARRAGMSEVEITRQAEQQKAAIRAQYGDEVNPIAGQMREWGDIQGNLIGASTQWTNTLKSGISGMLRGAEDMDDQLNSILDSIADIAVQWALSGIGGKTATSAGSALSSPNPVSGLANIGSKAPATMPTGGAGMKEQGMKSIGMKAAGVPVMHTGGIVGGRSAMRSSVNLNAFKGAKRLHTGGMVGGEKFGHGEIPIIAKKGEGVFTSEQMTALGSDMNKPSGSISINSPVTVNGSAGNQAQNDDLAKKIAKSMEQSMKENVAKELRNHMRPGNMLNRGRS